MAKPIPEIASPVDTKIKAKDSKKKKEKAEKAPKAEKVKVKKTAGKDKKKKWD